MEINEIKYFLAVAKTENMHKSSEEIGISPGSLSKAITKLEDELKVKLFKREGRNIKLTEYGRYLKLKGHELISLESSIKNTILGNENSFNISISGSEILLSHFGIEVANQIKQKYKNVSIQFLPERDKDLIVKVRDGEVDLGITTYDIGKEFDQKTLAAINFNTYISKKHPLYSKSRKSSIHINELLNFSFVVPQNNLLGKVKGSDSSDGWREDKFPRTISFSSTSLKTIESLVYQGLAVAYLPDYYANQANLVKLAIEGCPYQAKQKVVLFTKNKSHSGWLNETF